MDRHGRTRRAALRPPRPALAILAVAAIAAAAAMAAACSARRNQLVDIDGYRSWRRTTERALDFPIPGHGRSYRRIYVNDVGAAFRDARENGAATGNGEYPDGTIVVKEIYPGSAEPPAGAEPQSLDIMAKDAAAGTGSGGWRWIVRTKGADAEADAGFCLRCHDGANAKNPFGDGNPAGDFRDYLFY